VWCSAATCSSSREKKKTGPASAGPALFAIYLLALDPEADASERNEDCAQDAAQERRSRDGKRQASFGCGPGHAARRR